MLKFAIIGFGGLGKVHFRNVPEVTSRVKEAQLVAICDVDESVFHSQKSTNLGDSNVDLDLSAYHLYTDLTSLLDNEQLDFVITAVPTSIHEKVAVTVMERGIHVFSEKPMARTAAQAENMLLTAKKNNVKLMIGQCVRYSPTSRLLKEAINSEKYGKVIKAEFSRLSPTPVWGWNNWYMDEGISGGAALDMHIHDVDLVHWLFGVPEAVTSVATSYKSKHESMSTLYHYADKCVTAIGEWGLPGCYEFNSSFTVRFEKATLINNTAGLYLYPEDGEKEPIILPTESGYANEVVDFINCILEDRESTVNPPEDTFKSLKIALAEKVSADTGKTVAL